MATRIEVTTKNHLTDPQGLKTAQRLREDLRVNVEEVRVVEAYTIDKELPRDALERLRVELFTDPIIQESTLNSPTLREFDYAIEVGFLPGVTDNVGNTSREAVEDLLKIKFSPEEGVYSSKVYLIKGKLSQHDVNKIASALHNPLIERIKIKSRAEYEKDGGMGVTVPKVRLPPNPGVSLVDLEVPDEELIKLGKFGILDHVEGEKEIRRGPLALDLPSLYAIRDYFREMGRKPTDVEIESLAQTWSEHCKHTIFASPLDEIKDGLYKTFIQGATKKIRARLGKNDWCVSVFSDNSGVIRFNEDYNICYKVETHNSPSALDPYGGAITGIVGVNRDPLGTGMGAKLAINVYGFCFGNPFYDGELMFRKPDRTDPILHPKVIFEGVRRGVEHGGNKSGIPTAWGFVRFDPRYMGKPLVFVGTVGILPRFINGKPAHEKRARPGDLIVMAGGRIGKDGIHGATFSSEGLHEGSPAGAVQIGDPITQKKLADAQLEARDLGLYNSVTDNGAGGLSCSVGEMAKESGGAVVYLEKAPLKYPGLPPNEIWISESQERMTYAVPPDKVEQFVELMRRRGVEATVIGEFTNSGRCVVKFHNEVVMDIDLEFLHNGLPIKELRSVWDPPQHSEPEIEPPTDLGGTLTEMLSRLDICSKEYVVRQFDHEVQGGSVIKPLIGVHQDVHSDAVVMKPLLDSKQGVALSSALFPQYGDIDPYWMSACAIDTAVRALVCVGADPNRIALLDNFCWCSSDEPERLGQLKRSAQACYDFALAYNAPFISGKDSMFNDFKGFDANGKPMKISIPPTLLISSIGIVPDVTKCVSADFKASGDYIYVVGITKHELGASEYYALCGEKIRGEKYIGNSVPKVDSNIASTVYQTLAGCIQDELISSCAPTSLGGLGVTLARMAMAGRLGAEIDLSAVPVERDLTRDDFILFSESTGRIVLTTAPHNAQELTKRFKGLPFAKIGIVRNDDLFVLNGRKRKWQVKVEKLVNSYKKTFDW